MKEVSIEKFIEFVDSLRKENIKCKAKLMDDYEVVVECGRDYPDEMFDQVYNEAEKCEIQENLCVCAEFTGGTIITSERINGGPQAHNIFYKIR